MKSRCYNKNTNRYHRYGGRGITVCDRWLNSFSAFLDDMGKKPFPGAQIDRKENDKGYYKGNCHWTTNKENNQHTSRTKLNIEKARNIRKNANTISIKDMTIVYNVDRKTIRDVLSNRTWKE